ncbi:MAG: hypothetical protein F6K03_08510, partial [Kamptonema sp. SIO4C4]|nr:hypothetical protein [Kamptonema sp. SIO4C4]
TRFTVLPLLIVAVWSRVWLGWGAIAPVLLVLLWTWVNPRLFPKPQSTRNWASKAVLGERVWINRNKVAVPEHHQTVPTILNLISGLGLPFLIWGLYHLSIWPTLLGTVLVYLGKIWFVDRMVWLYHDMQNATPEYQSWLY